MKRNQSYIISLMQHSNCDSGGEQIVKDLLKAAKKTLAFIDDLSKSNPGFLGKLVLQDYAQWNEAMTELPSAIKQAEKGPSLPQVKEEALV